MVRMDGQMDLPNVPGYLLEAEIGEGSFGTVYRAFDETAKELVAIKCIKYLPSNIDNQVG